MPVNQVVANPEASRPGQITAQSYEAKNSLTTGGVAVTKGKTDVSKDYAFVKYINEKGELVYGFFKVLPPEQLAALKESGNPTDFAAAMIYEQLNNLGIFAAASDVNVTFTAMKDDNNIVGYNVLIELKGSDNGKPPNMRAVLSQIKLNIKAGDMKDPKKISAAVAKAAQESQLIEKVANIIADNQELANILLNVGYDDHGMFDINRLQAILITNTSMDKNRDAVAKSIQEQIEKANEIQKETFKAMDKKKIEQLSYLLASMKKKDIIRMYIKIAEKLGKPEIADQLKDTLKKTE